MGNTMANSAAGDSSAIQDAKDVAEMLFDLCGNDLILRKISGYLSVTDLMQLSCVNKYFLERVRTLYHFTSLSSQEITGRMEIHVFQLSRAIVKVNQLNSNALRKLAVIKVFQDTEYLELQALDGLSSTKRNAMLIQIVGNCAKLKSLNLEALKILVDDNDYESFLRDENVKTKIDNLTELHIGPPSINYELQFNSLTESFLMPDEPSTLTYELFEEINENLKLVKFTYTEPSVSRNCFHPQLLLNNSRETLRELKIAIDFKNLESLNAIKFPKLCKLELVVIRYYEGDTHLVQLRQLQQIENFPEGIIPFLRNHLCNLTEFQFGANYCFSLAPLCELLAQPKSFEKLKVLGFISYFGFSKPFSAIDWNFIKTMPNLRDFKLNYRCSYYITDQDMDSFAELFFVLPPSIKSIEIRGLKCARQANWLNTELSVLLRCKELYVLKTDFQFLNDELFQFICEHLTQLKILEGDFTDLTIFGIGGVNQHGNKTGISLTNLKDLVELEVYSWNNSFGFSIDELLNLIRFSSLVKLTVRFRKNKTTIQRLDGEQLLLLLDQNPSLEHLYLGDVKPPRNIRAKVLKLHPRFKWHWD